MKVIKVCIKQAGGVEIYESGDLDVRKGDWIVVEREKGCVLARALSDVFEYTIDDKYEPSLEKVNKDDEDVNKDSMDVVREPGIDMNNGVIETITNIQPFQKTILKVLRKATTDDFKRARDNKGLEKKAFDECKKLIEVKNLDMKLIDTETYLDRSKLIFYFISEQRIDFRELVRELARRFKTRIEMRQIGVRDALKIAGAIGPCGLITCCNIFLRSFESISVKMAREQNLLSNTQKLSGICGRLLCCLGYEHNCYIDMAKEFPEEGAIVETPDGRGRVISQEILSKKVFVKLESGEERKFDLKVIKNSV